MKIRAIATDLDGTLLRTDKSVSVRTRAAIHAAKEAGILVVVATGRPPRWIPPVIEALGDVGLVVCHNGATVYDPVAHEILIRTEISPAVGLSLIDDLETTFPEALIGVEQEFEFAIDESMADRSVEPLESWALNGVRVGPIRSFLDRPVTKLVLRFADAPDGTATRVQELVGDRALVTHSTSESFLELSHPSVHKAATVERLLVDLGITAAEVVAFGDMPNDLELIRWAGHGVAVANAHPELKLVADEVTASNDDDGVALVVERLLSEHAS